jgi:tetratricopeptide (TPR) repeat protein
MRGGNLSASCGQKRAPGKRQRAEGSGQFLKHFSREMPPTTFFRKQRTQRQRAIAIDETLAEAHASLGFITFWYDWNWDEAERECKRALELNPKSSEAHLVYAHLLSNTGRHAEALDEARRARELDPLNLRTNSLEAEFMIHAGRVDEALIRLEKVFELDANFWFAHLFAASAYIEKGKYREAVEEARRAWKLSEEQSLSLPFEGIALAKAGRRKEAEIVVAKLLQRSRERYVPPYHLALLHNGLGEKEATFAWLQQAYEQRDPKIAFLKVEPKWNNLRTDERFKEMIRKVGLPD